MADAYFGRDHIILAERERINGDGPKPPGRAPLVEVIGGAVKVMRIATGQENNGGHRTR